MSNYYEILGLLYTDDQAQIKRAYKKLALVLHPDKRPSQKKEAEKQFQQLNEAYSTLSDPERKASYDEVLAEHFKTQGVASNGDTSAGRPMFRVHVPSGAAASAAMSTSTAVAVQAEGVDFNALLADAHANEDDLLGHVLANPSLGFVMLENLQFFNSLRKKLQVEILIILFEQRGDAALMTKLIDEIQMENGKNALLKRFLLYRNAKRLILKIFILPPLSYLPHYRQMICISLLVKIKLFFFLFYVIFPQRFR